jgi:tetratricopeptide (TPR) repeat protein
MDTAELSVEAEVSRLRRLAQTDQIAQAAEGAEALLVRYPENRDLLLIAANARRRLRQPPEALALLDRLASVQPRYSRLHEERGLCFVQLKDAANATEALLLAVNLNPALPMSWRALEGVYRIVGDAENAATAGPTLTRTLPVKWVASITEVICAPGMQVASSFMLAKTVHAASTPAATGYCLSKTTSMGTL